MNTIVALVVGVLVVVFSWPRPSQVVKELDNWTCVALSTVYGLILAIAVAWPAQIVVGLVSDVNCPVLSPGACLPESISTEASYWGLLVGLTGTVVVFFVLKARIKKLAGRVPR
jgi:hypothetical protein